MSEYGVENGWLVEVVNEHTCGTGEDGYYGAHEPGCGTLPIARIEDLLHQQTGWALYNELVDRHNGERMHLEAVVAELKSLLRRACETDAHEDCYLDHNGGCQTHGFLSEPCPYPFIRQYLADKPELAW